MGARLSKARKKAKRRAHRSARIREQAESLARASDNRMHSQGAAGRQQGQAAARRTASDR
jgi:hypothetical protein